MTDEKAISERAYHIWEAEGRLHGRDREHWERASREIGAEAKNRPPKATAGTKPSGRPKAKPAKAAR
ncbi:MAG: DUF2934 domain-containing protein [Hyphomicrobiales bacterium]|nr:DUF2934 domain-containing protein [Hyphomicrobiales bacterium]